VVGVSIRLYSHRECLVAVVGDMYLNVIASLLSSKTGLSSSSKPVKTFCSANSGSISATSSSKAIKPRSTICSAATAVSSLVCEASRKTASSWMSAASSSAEVLPAAWLYWKLPVTHVSAKVANGWTEDEFGTRRTVFVRSEYDCLWDFALLNSSSDLAFQLRRRRRHARSNLRAKWHIQNNKIKGPSQDINI
jgi:hypothetical protein